MTDRELLESAARAAGIEGEYRTENLCVNGDWIDVTAIFLADDTGWWNPLTDGDEALRLAVLMAKYGAFHIDIYHSQTSCRVTPKDTTENEVYGVCWNDKAPEGCADIFDQNAATRRAIVRAASALELNLRSSVRPVSGQRSSCFRSLKLLRNALANAPACAGD